MLNNKLIISMQARSKNRFTLIKVIFVALFSSISWTTSAKPLAVVSNLPAPKIEAKAWVLMEMNSGVVVTSHNPDLPLPPASITKLMMNYVVFARLRDGDIGYSDKVPISEEAWRAEGSRMFADVNSRVELGHLLKSTIIQSGNDAAIALAEFTAGSEFAFAQLMNQSARELGLNHSNFVNSSGLPAEGHAMSANDIAVLAAAIIREFPEFYTWYAERTYTHNNITQQNRNRLLWKDDSVDGLKTGHTQAAGYCLVASAKRGKQRWIAVVLGSQSERSRERQVQSLLNFGFAAYDPIAVLDEQGGIASIRVFGGVSEEVLLHPVEPINIVVPKGREKDLEVTLQHSPYFEAPIEVGQGLGIASLSLDGKSLAEVPLVARSEIAQAGWWKRLVDSIKLSFYEATSD